MKSQIRVLLVAPILVAWMCTNTSASILFEFEQDVTGDILAELHIDGTSAPGPFDHTDVVSLSFTPAGDAIFGFGVGLFGEPFIFPSKVFELDSTGQGLRGVSGEFGEIRTAEFKHNPVLLIDSDKLVLTFDNEGATPTDSIRNFSDHFPPTYGKGGPVASHGR